MTPAKAWGLRNRKASSRKPIPPAVTAGGTATGQQQRNGTATESTNRQRTQDRARGSMHEAAGPVAFPGYRVREGPKALEGELSSTGTGGPHPRRGPARAAGPALSVTNLSHSAGIVGPQDRTVDGVSLEPRGGEDPGAASAGWEG